MASGCGEKFCLTSKDFHASSCYAIQVGRGHHQSIVKDVKLFQSLREEEDFLDVILVSGDNHQVSSHKLILAANSKFFQGILKRNKHPCPLIYLRDVKHSDLLLLLTFMYTGEVTVEQKELGSFLKTGEDLGVKGLAGDDSGGSREEEVTPRSQEQRPRGVMPEVPLDVAMVKTETGSMEAGEEEGAWQVQNIPDGENNSQEYGEGVVSGQEMAGVGVIMNPTSHQRNEVFDQYTKATLKEGKMACMCLLCGKEFSRKQNVIKHVEAVHVKNFFQYQCRYCSKVLNSFSHQGNHEAVCVSGV